MMAAGCECSCGGTKIAAIRAALAGPRYPLAIVPGAGHESLRSASPAAWAASVGPVLLPLPASAAAPP